MCMALHTRYLYILVPSHTTYCCVAVDVMKDSHYTTLRRHVVNGVINLGNPGNPQPPNMYFVCERPISMAVERWTNLSMSQQPAWTSDTLITCDLNMHCSVSLIPTLVSPSSQAFSEDDVTQQLQARNLKVGWNDGAYIKRLLFQIQFISSNFSIF